MTMEACSTVIQSRTKLEPIKPAPPVTRIVLFTEYVLKRCGHAAAFGCSRDYGDPAVIQSYPDLRDEVFEDPLRGNMKFHHA